MPADSVPHDPKPVSMPEEWLRVTLASIGDAVLATDTEGRVTWLNRTAEELTGWSLPDAAGRPLAEVFRVVSEETRREVENPAARALREGVVVGLANHSLLIARDGSETPVDDSAAPIRDESGRVSGVVLVFRDVTERRAAERAVRESEERLRSLVESAQDYAIFMLDPAGHVTSWNPGAARIKGYAAEEIVGRHFSAFYPPEALAKGWPAEELRRAAADGRIEDEGWRLRKDGSRFWANVVITAIRDEHGALRGFWKITRDLTERRMAAEAVAAREERFRAIAASANDAIITADSHGRVLMWNAAATRIFGWEESEVLGQPLTRCVPERLRAAHEEGLARLRAGGVPRLLGRTVELDALRKDGTELPVELSLSTWTIRGVPTYCGIVRDLTERRQLARSRAEAEFLADADRRKDEFLAMLSHELRNPLAPILSAVHLLQLRHDTDPVRQQAAVIIERQVGKLTRLVDDLLDVSRVTTGRIRLQPRLVDLRRSADEAADTTRPLFAEHRHELTVARPAEPLWVLADPTRLEQVAVNLLTNAAKYTPDGGRIRLTTSLEDGEAVLRVADSGVGISPELLPRIFDLFTQADRSLDRSQGGLGVGLTVVQRVVEMHGGRVEAHSDGPGRGSEFVVRLPLAEAPAEPSPEPARREDAGAPRLRVLVVDDNRDAADATALLLRSAGHDVRAAYSGAEALAIPDGWRPGVVLLDIGLPGMDGYEVARRLRSDAGLGAARILAITGYGQDADRRKTQEAGFDGHLVKPVDPQVLLAALAPPG